MKNTLRLMVFFLLAFTLNVNMRAQNLVPNPSFEQHTACPYSDDQVPFSTGWQNYGATPEYFNSCATYFPYSVPSNIWGSYQTASSGNAYCGFYAYSYMGHFISHSANIREIIGRQLSSPLKIGNQYYVSIKVSLAYNYSTGSANCATNNIGVKFSTNPINYGDSVHVASPLVNNFAHIYETSIITDTVNWTTISGSFIADSAYDYILLGNFFDSIHTDTVPINPAMHYYCRAYYYFDDICISESPNDCGITGEGFYNAQLPIAIYPNPFNKITEIILSDAIINEDDEKVLLIYGMSGNLINKEIISNKRFQLDAGNLSPGVYLLQIRTLKQNYNEKIIITN
jgi:hypothetical protein